MEGKPAVCLATKCPGSLEQGTGTTPTKSNCPFWEGLHLLEESIRRVNKYISFITDALPVE